MVHFPLLGSLLITCALFFLPLRADELVLSSAHGCELANEVRHEIDAPAQLVAGNGDISLMWNGAAGNFDCAFGKADFWGVVRGNITTAGHLHLQCAEITGGTMKMAENVGPATLTGTFTGEGGASLDTTSWIAYPQNLVVTEIKNTGTKVLNLNSDLVDGLNSPSLPGDAGTSDDSTWLHVSPDLVDFQIGNREIQRREPDGKTQKNFCPIIGRVAGVEVTATGSAKPYLAWNPSDPLARNIGTLPIDAKDDHGGSVQIDGQGDHRLVARGGLMPQNGFTFMAWINPIEQKPDATVFAATAREKANQYPYFRGFLVHLVEGKPEVRYNYFSATASSAVPLNQWTEIKAVYANQKLTLFVNGQLVAVGTNPPASDQMGWDKATLRTGDPALPFKGCAPEAILRQRVLGATATVVGQGLHFSLSPGQTVRLLVALVSDRNTPDYRSVAVNLANSNEADLAKLRAKHDDWWKKFWSQSFVELPDARIQANWYGSLYVLACCSRADCPPPGLWHNFIDGMSAPWDGDYTLDYNYQAPFWAAYAANHFELADNYEPLLLDHIGRGEAIARNAWRMNSMQQPDSLEKYLAQRDLPEPSPNPNRYQGIYLYTHLIPLPGWSNDFGTFWNQKSNALFCTVNMVQRWRLTRDLAYAKKVYPFLKGTADFWDDYLVLQNGHYISQKDALCEGSGDNVNPATTLSFMRLLYPSLIEISERLKIDADRRGKWHDVLERLSPFTFVDAASVASLKGVSLDLLKGKQVIRDSEVGPDFPRSSYLTYQDRKQTGSSAGMSCVQTVFPGWSFGLESPQAERNAALNTVTFAAQWYDSNNDCNFYPAAAAIGYAPKEILANLDGLLETSEQPNFTIKTFGGGTEDDAIVPATLHNMFLQSYQTNLHIFPNWPTELDAAFGQLPACGGFLVSSRQRQGKICYAQILSQAGETCRVMNPWGEAPVSLFSSGKTQTLSGSVLTFATMAGQTYLLTPRGGPISVRSPL